MLPWQRSEDKKQNRNSTFCYFGCIFHHLTSFSTTGPRDKQLQIIMKYHPVILYAKYHFVCHVGWHFKLKHVLRNGQNRSKNEKCALSMAHLCIAIATLVGYMQNVFWILKEETCGCFKEQFSHLNFLAKSLAKNRT